MKNDPEIYKKAKGFNVNPQNINRTGLNRKQYTYHINEIKSKGYKAPHKNEYFEMIGLLLVMDETDLKAFAKDETKPYWIRLIIIDLQNKSTRQRMMADYRDWLFGKAETKFGGSIKIGLDAIIEKYE